jgi:hypothetical protein
MIYLLQKLIDYTKKNNINPVPATTPNVYIDPNIFNTASNPTPVPVINNNLNVNPNMLLNFNVTTRQNVGTNPNKSANTTPTLTLNDLLQYYLQLFTLNWPIPQCKQLTDISEIKQPIFVRYGRKYLVGIKIKSPEETIQSSSATAASANNTVPMTVGGRINKLWNRLLKYKNKNKSKKLKKLNT